MSTTVVIVALCYFAVMVGIGLWAAIRTRTHTDFYVAGRGVGVIAIGLATMSSAVSGFSFIGGPGIQYAFGFGTLMLVIPVAGSFAITWYLLAKRMRLLAEARSTITIPDAIHARYDSNVARGLAAIAILLGVVGYLATQTLAMGLMLSRIFDIALPWGVVIGVTIVALYAVGGGMIAGIYTDVVQGGVMAVASVAIFWLALDVGGGMGNMVTTIAVDEASWVGPFGSLGAVVAIGWYFVFGLGLLGQPHVLHKFYMIRDPKRMKWGAAIAAVAAMLTTLVWLAVGTVMKYLEVKGEVSLSAPDQAAPVFMLQFAPPLLAGLFFAGVAAASMSTADSFLNIGAAAITRDLPLAFGHVPGEAAQLLWGRIVTLLLALLGGTSALVSGELVAIIGIFGWGMFAATLAAPLALGLNWERATKEAAILAILTGAVLQAVLELNAQFGWFGEILPGHLYRASVSFMASFVVFIGVSFCTRREQLPADLKAVMRA